MTEHDLIAWLQDYLADLLGVSPQEIGTDIPLEFLGVDSATALVLSADLTAQTGCETPPRAVFDHPTLAALARHLAESTASAGAPVGAVAR